MGSKLQAVPSGPVLQPGSGQGGAGARLGQRVFLSPHRPADKWTPLPGQESHILEEEL